LVTFFSQYTYEFIYSFEYQDLGQIRNITIYDAVGMQLPQNIYGKLSQFGDPSISVIDKLRSTVTHFKLNGQQCTGNSCILQPIDEPDMKVSFKVTKQDSQPSTLLWLQLEVVGDTGNFAFFESTSYFPGSVSDGVVPVEFPISGGKCSTIGYLNSIIIRILAEPSDTPDLLNGDYIIYASSVNVVVPSHCSGLAGVTLSFRSPISQVLLSVNQTAFIPLELA